MGLRRCLLTAVLAAVPALTCSVTLAQSAGLSTEVVMSSSSLSSAQQNQVNQYVADGMNKLTSGDPAQIAEGRRRLVDPFTLPGVTDLFLAAYSPAISRELVAREVLSHESPVVRTNAMIVASRLSDGGVVLLIQQGLKDTSPSVRYWAATTAANTGGQLNAGDRKAILRALNASWEKEASINVLEKILVAMDGLNTPEAALQLLQVLNHRVDIHAGDPSMPINAELEGLQGVTVRTFTELTGSNHQVSPEMLKQLVIALFRYLDLSTTLQQNPAASGQTEDLRRLTLIAGNYLPRLAPRIVADPKNLRLPGGTVAPNDPAATRLLVEEWRRTLTSGPFGITQGQLVIEPVARDPRSSSTESAPLDDSMTDDATDTDMP